MLKYKGSLCGGPVSCPPFRAVCVDDDTDACFKCVLQDHAGTAFGSSHTGIECLVQSICFVSVTHTLYQETISMTDKRHSALLAQGHLHD